jgi:hypothetical protein
MEIPRIEPVEKFRRTPEQVAEIRALSPLGSADLRQEIRDRGRTLRAEVLVFLLRQGSEDTVLVNECAAALIKLNSPLKPQNIVRQTALRFRLHDPEHQKELWMKCEERMWEAIARDREKYYLWEVRFGLALRQVAETYAARIKRRLVREQAECGGSLTAVDLDIDTFAGDGELDEEVLRKVDTERLLARLSQVIDLLPEPHRSVAQLCKLERRSQAEASRELGLEPRSVSSYVTRIDEILRRDPQLATILDSLDLSFPNYHRINTSIEGPGGPGPQGEG